MVFTTIDPFSKNNTRHSAEQPSPSHASQSANVSLSMASCLLNSSSIDCWLSLSFISRLVCHRTSCMCRMCLFLKCQRVAELFVIVWREREKWRAVAGQTNDMSVQSGHEHLTRAHNSLVIDCGCTGRMARNHSKRSPGDVWDLNLAHMISCTRNQSNHEQ